MLTAASFGQRPSRGRGALLGEDRLTKSALDLKLQGLTGFPEAADALAYEPVQRLLAIGAKDGRIKIVGREGVEATLSSETPSSTRYMQFLTGRGVLLRITEEGDVQLWSVARGKLVESIPCATPVVSVASLPDDPFILLAEEGGGLQVAALINAQGEPALAASEPHSIALQPYQISAEDVHASGEVVSMAAFSHGDQRRLLLVHADSGAVIWDIRYQTVIAATNKAHMSGDVLGASDVLEATGVQEAGQYTAGCWLGSKGTFFATGHQNGSICIWATPKLAASNAPPAAPLPCAPMQQLHVTPPHLPAAPIEDLVFVSHDSFDNSSLLVLGGQAEDEPAVLSLLPMPNLHQEHRRQHEDIHTLPWFGAVKGFALVPPEGSINEDDDPVAIIVLTEGGQLMVHDLANMQPVPLSLPFQELPAVTVSAIIPAHLPEDAPACTLHGVTLPRLRAARDAMEGGAKKGSTWRWRWVFGGGKPPHLEDAAEGTSDHVLLTGHSDGRVRVWDLATEVPGLLATVPFDSGGAGTRLRAVTAIQLCVESGLLAVGHDRGDTRLYQFSEASQEVRAMAFDGRRRAQEEEAMGIPRTQQPPGFQRILQAQLHEAGVTSLALTSRKQLLAAGDASGNLTIINLAQPAVTFWKRVADQRIQGLAFGPASLRPNSRVVRDDGGDARMLLYILAADCGMMVLDSERGEPAAKDGWMRPKNQSPALTLALLSASGAPLPPLSAPASLAWAQNNAQPDPGFNHDDATGPSDSDSEAETAHASSRPGSRPASRPGSFKNRLLIQDADTAQPGSPGSPRQGLKSSHRSIGAHAAEDVPSAAAERLHSKLGGSGSAPGTPLSSHHGKSLHADSSDDEDDMDEDSMLAAAAAAAEQPEQKPRRRERLKSLFSHIGKRDSHAPDPKPAAAAAEEPRLSARTLKVRWSRKGTAAEQAVPSTATSHASGPTASPGSSHALSTPFAMRPNLGDARTASLASDLSSVDVPTLEPAQTPSRPMPVASHVLVVSRDTIRVYPAEGVAVCDRTTARKFTPPEEVPLLAAAAFSTAAGPGIVFLTAQLWHAVHTLPGLEPIQAVQLSMLDGFPPKWHEPEPDDEAPAHLGAWSPDASALMLMSPSGELARISLLDGLGQPARPESLWDWDLAKAAVAAQQAIGDLRDLDDDEDRSKFSAALPSEASDVHEGSRDQRKAQSLAARISTQTNRGLGQLQNQFKNLPGELDKLGKDLWTGKGFVGRQRAAPPTLEKLFAGQQHPSSPSGSPSAPAPAASSPSSPPHSSPFLPNRTSSRQPQPSRSAGPSRRVSGASDISYLDEDEGPSTLQERDPARAELFRGATARVPPRTGLSGPRTAEDIKAAYGRATTKRAEGTRAIMEENISKLAERGERLQKLDDTTAEMSNEADNFATMAKRIAEIQSNKKWWQF